MASMLLFFNVYVQENDNYVRKRKQRKEVKQNEKNNCYAKDLIHLHFRVRKRFYDGGITGMAKLGKNTLRIKKCCM